VDPAIDVAADSATMPTPEVLTAFTPVMVSTVVGGADGSFYPSRARLLLRHCFASWSSRAQRTACRNHHR
jgi:hypothetical protein